MIKDVVLREALAAPNLQRLSYRRSRCVDRCPDRAAHLLSTMPVFASNNGAAFSMPDRPRSCQCSLTSCAWKKQQRQAFCRCICDAGTGTTKAVVHTTKGTVYGSTTRSTLSCPS